MSTTTPAGGPTQPPERHGQAYDLSVTGRLTPSGQPHQAYDLSVTGRMTAAENNDQAFELSIDQQVEKFLELRQKLSYFLITASIAVIAFSINFYIKNIRTDKVLVPCTWHAARGRRDIRACDSWTGFAESSIRPHVSPQTYQIQV